MYRKLKNYLPWKKYMYPMFLMLTVSDNHVNQNQYLLLRDSLQIQVKHIKVNGRNQIVFP